MLANRQGHGEAFAELDAYTEMDRQAEDAGVDDETYLDASGVDSDAVAAAGDRAGQGSGGGQSRKETVLAALDALDTPTEADVVAYADERGVPAEYTGKALRKLVRAGEVTQSDEHYRRL